LKQEGCVGSQSVFQNPWGSEKQGIKLRMRKQKNEMKEQRISSYLVQTALKIVYRISRNQLIKIERESTSKAPTDQSSNENGEMKGKRTLLIYLCIFRVKY